jgi:hypothetical protein
MARISRRERRRAGVATNVGVASQGWVRGERRFLGLDRRTFKPALFALIVALLLIFGLPALNAAIPWHREIKDGDVLDLGGGAAAVPPIGWQLEQGVLAGTAWAYPTRLTVVMANGGATIDMRGTSFTGPADAFLDQVQRSEGEDPTDVGGSRTVLTTDAGLIGVVQTRSGPDGEQLDAAFKMAAGSLDAMLAAPALLVRIRLAPDQIERYQDDVAAFLVSITPEVDQ